MTPHIKRPRTYVADTGRVADGTVGHAAVSHGLGAQVNRAAPDLAQTAQHLADRWGLAALDALHIAAAFTVGAVELITTGRRTSPLVRVTDLPVRTLADS